MYSLSPGGPLFPMNAPIPSMAPAAQEYMVVLRPGGQAGPGESNARAFASWDACTRSDTQPLGFYLDGWTADAAADLALQVRRGPWWDRPVWLPPGSAVPPTADGAAPYADALAASERALAARRSLRLRTDDMRLEERVLYFLYLRDNAELQPVCDRSNAMLYAYPVVDALARPGEDAANALTALARRKLLEPSTLIDRTRHCRACGCAHIHYLDVCPHCSSLQIRREPSLHCFACGHVAPEKDFHGDGALSCPQCHAALRHIGVDYDRPLTQYACGSCHHVFVETTVQARCLDCGTTAEPNALDVREIATLRLSAHGRTALRAGQIQETFAALDTANYVEPPQFRRMLDWALATSARHAEMRFGLMLIEFQNATGMIERYGAARVFLMLDEFARRLHELLRTSDITTRTQEEKLWLFLPFSAPEGLAARLRNALASQAEQDGGPPLQARIRHMQVPGDVRPGDHQAESLMERLQERA